MCACLSLTFTPILQRCRDDIIVFAPGIKVVITSLHGKSLQEALGLETPTKIMNVMFPLPHKHLQCR